MKKFLIDQTLFLMIGVTIIILIPIICGPVFTLFFEIIMILCWGYLCRRILLLPVDLVLGELNKTVYFANQCGVEHLEFFKGNRYEWKFYFGNDQTLRLLVPNALTDGEICQVSLPQKDAKVRITYFRLSKLLLRWEPG